MCLLIKTESKYIDEGIIMRKKRLVWNTTTSLVYQLVTIICGLILPRLILNGFGSEVNGLVNSIKQFLTVISFLELGVGAVVQSALYKPLSENDTVKLSQIVTSANIFFRKIAFILAVYIVGLLVFYPKIVNAKFGYVYTDILIIAISIGSLVQYYFGIVDMLFLNAAQRGYVQYIPQSISIILNTLISYIMIRYGASIQAIKFVSSLIYLVRPIVLRIYIRKHYSLNYHEKYSAEPISQKWNGVAQHIAAIVLDSTDVIVLSTFSTLANVSIYSVYYLVVSGVKQLFMSLTNGFQSLIGELWARREIDELNRIFGWFEWLIHTGTVFFFGCTGILMLPFVQVYTKGITDANYIQPFFAALITIANAGHCLRLPYNIMILSGGHYKQTQSNYIIAAVVNIIISVIAVNTWGLVGVAIGTLIAMFYQTVWMAIYDSKNLIKWPLRNFIKQCFVDFLTVVIASLITSQLKLTSIEYISWLILAIKTAVVWIIVIWLINLVFYNDKIRHIMSKIGISVVKER